MLHRPIILKNISHSFAEKICFTDFSHEIIASRRICIIGRNGTGKSTLLKIIQEIIQPMAGTLIVPSEVTFAYVPQLPLENLSLSGGEQFNKTLTPALRKKPNVLCLDEPTNHLDQRNKKSLLKFLQHFPGTFIIVSHDEELLSTLCSEIWQIEEGKVTVFQGSYESYLAEKRSTLQKQEHHLKDLKKTQKALKEAYQEELKRSAQSNRAGRDENDRKLKGAMKEKGSRTLGRNRGKINQTAQEIQAALNTIRLPDPLKPRFLLNFSPKKGGAIISIEGGACGYEDLILKDINFYLQGQERVAILGDNGSGKSTFFKALLKERRVKREGEWQVSASLGYLDQHYNTLPSHLTAFEVIKEASPLWNTEEIRRHLNSFLFRKNYEVESLVKDLSGGEKARLSLAQLAANTPQLLLLDEMTNNVDLETKAHIIQVLQNYPGALLVISHDLEFLKAVNIGSFYIIKEHQIFLRGLP